jgi:hypothetical protein
LERREAVPGKMYQLLRLVRYNRGQVARTFRQSDQASLVQLCWERLRGKAIVDLLVEVGGNNVDSCIQLIGGKVRRTPALAIGRGSIALIKGQIT